MTEDISGSTLECSYDATSANSQSPSVVAADSNSASEYTATGVNDIAICASAFEPAVISMDVNSSIRLILGSDSSMNRIRIGGSGLGVDSSAPEELLMEKGAYMRLCCRKFGGSKIELNKTAAAAMHRDADGW